VATRPGGKHVRRALGCRELVGTRQVLSWRRGPLCSRRQRGARGAAPQPAKGEPQIQNRKPKTV